MTHVRGGSKVESILNTIKKMLGGPFLGDEFDVDLITNINAVFLILNQLGVGPDLPYFITGAGETWKDFLGEDNIEMVKSYIFMKVKLIFDPPQSSSAQKSYEELIKEFEWRLNVQVDPKEVRA